MPRHWTSDEEFFLIDALPDYRKSIQSKSIQEQRQITKSLAEELYQGYAILALRSENAIFERLPYLDNLLAGVFEKEHYAVKDRELYGTQPREDSSREPNTVNKRHSYNGAMKDYLEQTRGQQ